jgi:hypothetical protein
VKYLKWVDSQNRPLDYEDKLASETGNMPAICILDIFDHDLEVSSILLVDGEKYEVIKRHDTANLKNKDHSYTEAILSQNTKGNEIIVLRYDDGACPLNQSPQTYEVIVTEVEVRAPGATIDF